MTSLKAHSPRRDGMTMVEMLVVLLIISVLAAITLPVFQKVQETGKAAADMSNLRQIGIAITAHLNEYGDQLPFSMSDATDGKAWGQYLVDAKRMPEDLFKSRFDARPADEKPCSFGYNSRLKGRRADDLIPADVEETFGGEPGASEVMLAIPAPASGVELRFEGNIDEDVQVSRGSSSPGGAWETGKEGVLRGRKRTTALFLDSHMEQVGLNDLLRPPPDDTAAQRRANRFWLTY